MPRIVTFAEYLATLRPSLQWLVEGLVPFPGTILLEGPPKHGKSFLALDLARTVSQGLPFLGRPTRQATTLYLQFDTSELVWRDRLEKIEAHGITLNGPMYTVHPEDQRIPINVLNTSDRMWLKDIVDQVNPALTVIDVLREIHNGDENDSTPMKIVGDVLASTFQFRTLVIVHHSKKINAENTSPDPSDIARGSSYITGKVDSLWLLWQSHLKIHSRFNEPVTMKLKQTNCGLWQLTENKESAKEGVLKLVKDFPEMSNNALAKLAEQTYGVSRRTFYYILEEAKHK